MNLKDITTKCFIMALIIRDDGERLLLGSGRYEFKEDQKHFAANAFSNDVVEVQGNDGVFLAGQVRRAATQVFDGFVGDGTTSKSDVEKWRTDFLRFFRKEHFYKVIYIFPDGTSIQRRQGFIVDAPEVPELYQMFPEYHVGLNFEDVNYYTYAEDDDGAEKYARLVELMPYTPATSGGLVWDETGAVWDETGAVWSAGGGAQENIVNVDSIDLVQPIWHVVGPCTNPSVTVLTTGTTLTFNGTVAEGQELVVDNFRQTAMLSGTSVIESMSGDWLLLAPGANRVVYNVTLMPSTNPTIDDLTYMQDFAKYDSAGIQAIVASMVEEQVYTLIDKRNSVQYKIALLKDGNIWMLDDLRIANYRCTPEDTDIAEGFFQIPESTPGNYPGGSTAETIAVRVEEEAAYYSWAAATAGCKPADGAALISIMPKGWTLPTKADFEKLIQFYPTSKDIMAEPAPNFKRTGFWNTSGIANRNQIYCWSSTVTDGSKPDFLIEPNNGNLYVRGQTVIGNGFAIRGVVRKEEE